MPYILSPSHRYFNFIEMWRVFNLDHAHVTNMSIIANDYFSEQLEGCFEILVR